MPKTKKRKRTDKRVRKHLNLTVPAPLKERLVALAAERGVTVTALAQPALEALVPEVA